MDFPRKGFWDLRDQILRFQTKTEQVQSQQARPRLLFTNIRDWDRDQENVYFWDQDRHQENGRDRESRWSLWQCLYTVEVSFPWWSTKLLVMISFLLAWSEATSMVYDMSYIKGGGTLNLFWLMSQISLVSLLKQSLTFGSVQVLHQWIFQDSEPACISEISEGLDPPLR